MDRQKPLADLQAQLQLLGEQFAQRLKEELPQLADRAQQLQRSLAGRHLAVQLQHIAEIRANGHHQRATGGDGCDRDLWPG